MGTSLSQASVQGGTPVLPVAVTERALVVAGGLPGAGKTTLLRRYSGVPALRVLDPEQVADPLLRHLPWIPYGVLRPLVHAVHWLRILVALVRHDGTVLVHETATRATARAALVALARVTGRAAYLLWLDVDPATARHRQRSRRRMLTPAEFTRHIRRVRSMEALRLRGWDSITILGQEAKGASSRSGAFGAGSDS